MPCSHVPPSLQAEGRALARLYKGTALLMAWKLHSTEAVRTRPPNESLIAHIRGRMTLSLVPSESEGRTVCKQERPLSSCHKYKAGFISVPESV